MEEEETPNAIPYKLVLLGESAVGKSSLVLRFVRGQFFENHESTIGAAFLTQIVPLDDNVNVKFEIWDTAGQERFRSLTPMYYRGAAAAIVVYDITSYESFQKCKSWVKELKRQENKDIVIAIAGNKLDLADDRNVDKKESASYAEEKGILFMETSAKSAHNVNEIFVAIAKTLPKERPGDKLDDPRSGGSIDIQDKIKRKTMKEGDGGGGGCC